MLQFGIKIKKKVKVIRDTNIYSGETYSSESYERFIDRVHGKKGTNFDDWRQKKESWSKVHELSITKMLCYSILFSSRFMFFFMRLFRYVLKFFFFFLMKKKLHSFISFNCNHAVSWDDFNAYFKLYYVLHQIILPVMNKYVIVYHWYPFQMSLIRSKLLQVSFIFLLLS